MAQDFISGGYVRENITGNANTSTTAANIAGGVLGSTPYQSAENTTTLLLGNTTTTKKVQKQTGGGAISAAPLWEQASIAECSDYSAGTWTPIDISGAGLTFPAASGTYEKIGRLVTARCFITFPTTSNSSIASIGGLPFTVANDITARQGYCTASTVGGGIGGGFPSVASTGFAIRSIAGTGSLTNVNLSASSMWITVVYYN